MRSRFFCCNGGNLLFLPSLPLRPYRGGINEFRSIGTKSPPKTIWDATQVDPKRNPPLISNIVPFEAVKGHWAEPAKSLSALEEIWCFKTIFGLRVGFQGEKSSVSLTSQYRILVNDWPRKANLSTTQWLPKSGFPKTCLQTISFPLFHSSKKRDRSSVICRFAGGRNTENR